MNTPLVSIITPFKNTEAFLPECLNSIIQQTYSNWELILVNDHSTDYSFLIAEEYTKKDNRIKLYNNSGKGIIAALQLAYTKSNGTYITRMDSDDIMSHDKIEVLLKNLLQYGKSHIALGLVKYFSQKPIGDGYKKYELWLNKLTKKGSNFTEIYKECVIPSPCWMIHRDDFKKAGGFSANRYPEDYDLTFRFYKQKFKIIPCKTILHKWRDYSTRSSRIKDEYSQRSLLEIRIDYFIKLDYNPTRPLVIWGAGDKGKFIAKKLIDNQIDFSWVCDNPNKIGKKIYEQPLFHFNYLKIVKQPQSIVTVANTVAQKEIKNYFNKEKQLPLKDYFFFC